MTTTGRSNPETSNPRRRISRRGFLKTSIGAMAALNLGRWAQAGPVFPGSSATRGVVRFGMATDLHSADFAGGRNYIQSVSKLRECTDVMNREGVDFLLECGDFKDQNVPPVEAQTLKHLRDIEAVFQRFRGPTFHVLGNHDADSISKTQFLTRVTNTGIPRDRGYYSFDVNGVHFVVLDANFEKDGLEYDHGNYDWTDANVLPPQLEWLERDLASADGPTIVAVHQLLDDSADISVVIRNSEEVRRVLESSGKVALVIQGHHHAGHYHEIAGIHYYTEIAMVDQNLPANSYAIIETAPDGTLNIKGYRRAVSQQLTSEALKRPASTRIQ